MAMTNAEKQAAHRARAKTFDEFLSSCITAVEGVAVAFMSHHAPHVGDVWTLVESYIWEKYPDRAEATPEGDFADLVVDMTCHIAHNRAESIRFWSWLCSSHFFATLSDQGKAHAIKQKELAISPADFHLESAVQIGKQLRRKFGWEAVPTALELRQKRRMGRKDRQ